MSLLLQAVVLSYVSIVPILMATDMSLDLSSLQHLFFVLAGVVPFVVYACWRRMVAVPEILVCMGSVLALAVPVLVWTYAAMRVGMPLADERLVAMDAALGFDWHAFIAFVDARPWLADFLAFSYSSFYLQLLFLPVVLSLFGRSRQACAMVFAYCVLCLISSVVCIWYPALGTYVVYGVAAEELAAINAKFGFFFLDQFHAVRQAGHFNLTLDEAAGIVTFPSVHAGVAALCAWASWSLRWIRFPMLALNVGMAAAAVSHANHYLIDVVAGVGIAGISASLATAMFYRRVIGAHAGPSAVTALTFSPAAASD